MNQTFVYFQPEYVNKFKCDGQSCNAHCCKYWTIDIDHDTYKKYNSIRPKSASKAITEHLIKKSNSNQYIVKLNSKKFCPFLTEDNWCSIQRKYGDEYLSYICKIYPRITARIGDFYERSLTLSCPVAANLILNQDEPMSFEQREISIKEYWQSCRDMVRIRDIPKELLPYVINIQYAGISLLQERSLTIDQRLIVMGYFFDQLEDIINQNKFKEIETLSMIYTSEDFLKNQVPNLIKSIEFNIRDYFKMVFDIFGILYGKQKNLKVEAQQYLDYIAIALEIKINDKGVFSLDEFVNVHNKNLSTRTMFLQKYSNIFENYLVQEFFSGVYPWRIKESISLNYVLFIATYKIVELMAVSMAIAKPDIEFLDKQIISLISWFVEKLDHDPNYMQPIADGFKDKNNIVKTMRSFLQG